jgi:hypothetical protein
MIFLNQASESPRIESLTLECLYKLLKYHWWLHRVN